MLQVVDGRVEDWMNAVMAEMWRTNRFLTKKAIYEYAKTTKSRFVIIMKIVRLP